MSDVYNAAERHHVREAAKAAKIKERQIAETITGVMSVSGGRMWMLSILERCHIFSISHTGNALNTAFNEGERNIGLQLFNDIVRWCPQRYLEMMNERNERDAADERRRESANGDAGDDGPDSTQPED